MRYSRARPRSEQGGLTVELVVLTPVVVLFVLVALYLGRYELARQQVIGAAQAAAQAASVVPGPDDANAAALTVARPVVTNDGNACTHLTVSTDTSDFVPGGLVQVTVTCQVSYSDLLVPGLTGGATVRAVVSAPIDPYRAVQ